ncbi:MAG: hypothetical protein M1819_002599 [Sarea resinae]|nr:MAG: hypothetical protein M1819_002599 [Sarea resinae]
MRSSRSMSTSSNCSSSSETEETMQIFVKNIAGETTALTIPSTTSISTLKSLLSLRTHLPATELRLVFAGKHLTSPDATLADYAIGRESTLHLALPLKGGAPPKKRCSFKDCRDRVPPIVGHCDFCSNDYCTKHRMLEDHRCEGLEDCRKESRDRNTDKLNSERTMAIKGV